MNAVEEERPKYEVVRSKRATADIVLERDGRLVVRAPEWAGEEQIERIVEAKLYWIYKNLAEWRDLNATRILRDYKSGEGFLYLGRSYRLKLVAEQAEPLLLKNGRFTLRRDLVESGDVELAKQAFRQYYVARGYERIAKRVEYFAPKVDVKPLGIEVKEIGHRWASCSPLGKLSFHWKCVMAPQTIIDYIIVHELCHFHYFDHSDAFWNEVDKVMPNYRERKEWLKVNGAGLDL
jgi:predicted metal-dependent hydrolase